MTAPPMLSPKWAPPGGRITVKKLLRVPLIPDSRWGRVVQVGRCSERQPKFVAARFPNYELEAQAAVQGIGAALLSPDLFTQFVAQGALVAHFSSRVEGPSSYWMLWTKQCAEAHSSVG